MEMRENRGRGKKHQTKLAKASASAAYKAGYTLAAKYLKAGEALTSAGVHKRIRRSGGRQGGPALTKEKDLLKSKSKAGQEFRLGIQAAVGKIMLSESRPEPRKRPAAKATKSGAAAKKTKAGKVSKAGKAGKRDSKGRFISRSKAAAKKTKAPAKGKKSRVRRAANPSVVLTPRQRQAFSRAGNVIPFQARRNPHLTAGSSFMSPLGPGEVVRAIGSSGYVVRWEDGTVETVLYPAAAALTRA